MAHINTTTAGGGTGNQTYTGTVTLQSNESFVATGTGTIALNALVENTNTPTFNLVSAGTVGTVSGVVSGSGGIVLQGLGTLTLVNGANSYTGVTAINGGNLSVSTLANGGSNSGIGAASNAATNLILNGGTLTYTRQQQAAPIAYFPSEPMNQWWHD